MPADKSSFNYFKHHDNRCDGQSGLPNFWGNALKRLVLFCLIIIIAFRLQESLYTNWGNLLLSKAMVRATIHAKSHDMFAQAEYKFDAVIRRNPESASAYRGKLKVKLELGEISYQIQAYDKAWQNFIEAININPEQPYAYSAVGDFYMQNGEYLKARQICELAPQELRTGNIALLRCIGLSSWYLGEFDISQNALLQALPLDPENAEINHWLARTYSWQGEFGEAKRYAHRAVEYAPTNIWNLALLGNIYRSMGQLDEARELYEEALCLDPENAIILQYLNDLPD